MSLPPRLALLLLAGLLSSAAWPQASPPDPGPHTQSPGQQSPGPQPAGPQLTTAWVAGAGSHAADTPHALWLSNGTALLDSHGLAGPQEFQILDPRSGERHTIGSMAAMVASLGALEPGLPIKDNVLPWPDAVDPAGTRAAYLEDGDVFLLDLASSGFTRLTRTAGEEKNPQFSPDGTRLAYVRDNDIYVYDLAAKSERRLTANGSATLLNGTLSWVYWEEIFGRHDTAYWWSPDSRSIAYLETDNTAVPVSTFVDFEPVHPRVVEQPYPRPGDHNPAVRVGIVAAAGGHTHWVAITDQPWEWILRVNWLPDSRQLSIRTLDRSQTNLGLYFAPAAGGAARRILVETDPHWVNVNDDLFFLAGGDFLWASERDGYMHLYRYAHDGTLINQVTRGDWAMASSEGGAFWVHSSVVGVDQPAGEVYFTALKDSSVERQLYRIRLDGSGLTRISAEPGRHAISMSPDARYYLDTYSNLRTLPALRLHASDGARKALLAAPRTELLPPGLLYPELTTIPAGDGFPMPAQILRPAGFDPARRYPVILHVYGGPSAPTVSDTWQNQTLFDNVMAAHGYVMVAIDNRAATAISKTLENTLALNPGAGETADLVAGVQWLKKQPWVDAGRVGVYGWSGGGTNTLNLMTRSSEFKAGIAGAPVTDFRFYDSKWAESWLKLPADNPAGYESASLIPRARDLHGALLLLYGTYDDNVHPQNEEAFMNALIAAGKPYRAVIFPWRKHGFVDEAAILARLRAMEAFWLENL